jgi:WD40 repeat protein
MRHRLAASLISLLLACAPTTQTRAQEPADEVAVLGSKLFRLGQEIRALDWSSDGKLLAVGTVRGRIYVLNSENGSIQGRLEKHRSRVTGLRFLPGDRRLFSCSANGELVLWKWETSEIEKSGSITDRGATEVFDLDAEKGLIVTAGSGPGMILWDMSTFKVKRELQLSERGFLCVRFVRGTTGVFYGVDEGTLAMWNLEKGALEYSFKVPGTAQSAVTVSSDGKTAYTAGLDGSIKVWDLPAGKLRTVIASDLTVQTLCLSRDDAWLSAGLASGHVWIRKVTMGDALTLGGEHAQANYAVSFSKDGARIAGSGGYSSAVRIWNTSNGKELTSLQGHILDVMSLDFTSDGMTLASGGIDGNVFIWDVKTHGSRVFACKRGSVNSIKFSSDGKRVACCTSQGYVIVLDVTEGKLKFEKKVHDGIARSICFAMGATAVLSVANDGKAVIVDSTTGQVLETLDLSDESLNSASADAGSKITLLAGSKRAYVFTDLKHSERTEVDLGRRSIRGAVLLGNGKQVIGYESVGAELLVVDINQPRLSKSHTIQLGRAYLTSMAVTPDSDVVLLGDNEGFLHRFVLSKGRVESKARLHEGEIQSIAITAQRRIATGASDGVICLTATK